MAASEFDGFCRSAFAFLESQGTRHLVVAGLAVVAIGEPRTTADADAIVFVSSSERLAIPYLERTLRPICELAEDMAPWNRLQRVLATVRSREEES